MESALEQPEYVAFTDFQPRPDQPDRYDEQTAFYESKLPGVAFMVGGNGAGTSETACGKLAKFVLCDQAPPRADTPFYVISDTYEQVMKIIWKEKLFGHGHIPSGEVDWERVTWYSSKDQWPFRVPLKPWPGRPGKNWTLEFKSYEQGRNNFQGTAVGGFLFSEQFPWQILEEVIARCREYSFLGAKMCEFTPVDPVLSAELEEMIDNDSLPPGWGVFRANTECAMEAGHVSEQWYHEFFGLVSEEMEDVRKIGAFGSYKGRIYPRFSKIHWTEEPLENLLVPGMYHRRAIDWGFGEDNAFCCHWGAKTGSGHWCYNGDMEVLTNSGWVRFDRLAGTEIVGTADITKSIPKFEWQAPTHFHQRWYEGEMIVSNGEMGSVKFSVTADHDMVLKKCFANKDLIKVKAGEMPLSRNYRIPISWDANLEEDDDHPYEIGGIITTRSKFAALIGLFVSEGYLATGSTWSLCITQKTKMDEVRKILSDFGGNWREYSNKSTVNWCEGMTDFRLNNKKIVQAFIDLGMRKPSETKQFPEFMLKWGTSLRSLLIALEIGDGLHDDPRGQRQYFTISDILKDQFTALCARLGIPTKVCHQDYNDARCWRIYLRKATGAVPAQLTLSREQVSKYVYCLTVPNGTLIVRHNGGTPFICGNCIYDEYYSTDQNKTVHDHLKEIADRMPWPENNPHYGVTYADPSDPGNIRLASKFSQYEPAYKNFNMQCASNRVLEGIEYVRWLMKQDANGRPRLVIHKKNCPKLIQQMKTYRWRQGASSGRNPTDAQMAPLKKDDHAVDSARYLLFSESNSIGITPEGIRKTKDYRRFGIQMDQRL